MLHYKQKNTHIIPTTFFTFLCIEQPSGAEEDCRYIHSNIIGGLHMKHSKLITWFSAALLGIAAAAACSAGMAAEAATTPDGLYDYELINNNSEVKITDYNGSATTISIPTPIAGKPVTEIDSYAFYYDHVTSVTLPTTLKKIGFRAFYHSNLTSITLPASVTYVDQYAFSYCLSLNSVTINGPAELDWASFWNCPALTQVQLSSSSRTISSESAFMKCPALHVVNGCNPIVHHTDSNGYSYPVLNSNAETAVRNHFCRSTDVGFVNDFCTELCKYVVKTETGYDPDGPENQPGDWMNDALKARQLHDWLFRHCEYEDSNGSERTSDMENQVASSVFLSYALNIRGAGIGESVCNGYTKAYTMLLAAAGIESYRVSTSTHGWNIVKIRDKAANTASYYEVDVTWDDTGTNPNRVTLYSTGYTYFLKSHSNMILLHGSAYASPVMDEYGYDEHPLLNVYNPGSTNYMNLCTVSYSDENRDGSLDNDYDLDGTAFGTDYWEDMLAYSMLCGRYFGYDVVLNDKMPEVLYMMHQAHHGVWG